MYEGTRASEGSVRRYLVLAAVAAAAVLAGCGSGGGNSPTTPTSTNHNPSIGSISITPAYGISGLTVFSMNGSATDPDGDPLTYRWTYGGNSYTGATTSTAMNGDGSVSVQLTVTDGKGGTASDSRNVTLGTMTGTWLVTLTGCGTFSTTLTQSGGTVTGTFVMPTTFCNAPAGSTGKTDPAEPGTIDANGNLVIRLKVGIFLDFYIRGKMDDTGRRVNATAANSGFTGNTVTMIKQ